jgi:hypothetical protein
VWKSKRTFHLFLLVCLPGSALSLPEVWNVWHVVILASSKGSRMLRHLLSCAQLQIHETGLSLYLICPLIFHVTLTQAQPLSPWSSNGDRWLHHIVIEESETVLSRDEKVASWLRILIRSLTSGWAYSITVWARPLTPPNFGSLIFMIR